MEAEYDEVLYWVDPGPSVPGEAAAPSETPWGEGIQLAGVVQHLKGRQTSSLMADSYGFQSQEELLRVQKYLKDHGGWQLEQVSYRPKRLVACYSLSLLSMLNLLVACVYPVVCLLVSGVGNCMYTSIKKGLGVHLATEKQFPYYLTRYFRCQVANWLVANRQKVMLVKGDYIRQAYGIRDEDMQFPGPFSYREYCRNVLDKRFWGMPSFFTLSPVCGQSKSLS